MFENRKAFQSLIDQNGLKFVTEKVPANNTPEVKKFLFNCIDLTTLKSEDSDESVMKSVSYTHLV